MKVVIYLLAAVGLMFLGAVASDLMDQSHRGFVSAEPVWQGLPAMGTSSVFNEHVAMAAIRHDPWSQLAMLGVVTLFLSVMALFALFALKKILHGNDTGHGQNSGEVQELYQLGKSLEKRMESLETILLERSRPAL